MPSDPSVLAFSGGVGGAKLALGLYRVLEPWNLAVVANTGDDFEHLGLPIAPDTDTIMYTLAGENNRELGWGRAGETWTFMAEIERLGGETWFGLGDGDLAVHMQRAERLRQGDTLSTVTADFCRRKGIEAEILPMSDDPISTKVISDGGREVDFQHYLVRDACEPVAHGFRYVGAEHAEPNQRLMALLRDPSLRAVVICPSNPYVSIDPILVLPGVREALSACPVPVVAVSPIVGGRAIKGPLAKMLAEQELPVNALSIARHYEGLLSGFVLDQEDGDLAEDLELPVLVTQTIMRELEDHNALAQDVLEFADGLGAPAARAIGSAPAGQATGSAPAGRATG